ncbi:MAG: glycoside hydrolase family 3 C-terminal domain-containing protein, partial [Lachnospiraceae bacterium]|nr:glycoside hydrolase family 3 C-terminal domain-containing protein [Lachnospiraceae bacterium]
MKRKTRSYSGTRDSAVSAREIKNRAVALKAAEEGIVLLKNEGVLPLNKGMKIALFGSGAGHTIKGGTGSGDVNEREAVTIYQGLVNAGFDVTSVDWLESFDQIYQKSREDWKNQILEETEKNGPAGFFMAYVSHPYEMPAGRQIVREDFGDAKTSVYVISRIAGEGGDRSNRSGDYYLTEHEKEDLKIISENSENVIVILNAGGQIDMKDILCLTNVKAILSVVQPGMEGGNALAKILTGDVTPSGKLAETWAKNYEDFPNAASFSHVNGNTQKERYEEGIYIGYRYFDSFRKEVEYPFGFGLSYTEFEISAGAVTAAESSVTVSAAVRNVGTQFAGKEIVQVYATCPQGGIPKEYKRLCAFAKTGLLQPGESETLTITFPAKALASFDEKRSAWVVENGLYGIWMGNSSQDPALIGVLKVETDAVIEEVKHICPLQEELNELVRPNTVMEMEAAWHREADEKGLAPIIFAPEKEERTVIPDNELDRKAAEVVEQLSDEELTAMVIGEISKGQDALG